MKEYAISRGKVSRTLYSNKSKGKVVQRTYLEIQDADAETMWGCREELKIDNYHMPNNVALCEGHSARSAKNGHSEMKAIGYYLSKEFNSNINVYTERKPCEYCRKDLEHLDSLMPGCAVIAHYLIDYVGGDDDKAELRNIYIENGLIEKRAQKRDRGSEGGANNMPMKQIPRLCKPNQ